MIEEIKENITTDEGSEVGTEKETTIKPIPPVPYGKFKEINDKYRKTEGELKNAQEELESFKEVEKKKTEAKLLEDKKYEELLSAKELEIEKHKN